MVGLSILGRRVTRGRTVRPLEQTGKRTSIVRDRGRKSLAPGKRISRTGNIYWETRKNRSDKIGKKI